MIRFGLFNMTKVALLTLTLLLKHEAVSGYNILLLSANIKSQMVQFCELGTALAERGHDVTIAKGSTFVMPVELKHPRITIEMYHVSAVAVDDNSDLQDALMQNAFNFSIKNFVNLAQTMVSLGSADVWSCFNDKEFVKRLADAKFDFAILSPPFAQPFVYTAYALGLPFAYMGAECLLSQMTLPSMSPSYVPSFILGSWITDDMNVLQKSINTLAYMAYVLGMSITAGAGKVHELIPERSAVSFAEIDRTASLCLRVRESVLETPRPNLPNVINIGSLLIRKTKVLPEKTQQFLDTSSDGVVYVSFGSVVDKLPDDVLVKMAEAFKKTKYKIIWKRKTQPKIHLAEDKFLILPWAPQADILAHPNTKCFVSHCGYGSSLESVYFGVPVVGLPMYGDQGGNANMLQHKGYAKVLDKVSFTADDLTAAIEDVITGPESVNVKKASIIFKDMPSGKEKAVFWIEHVIKHGAEHLQSRAQRMPLWEYFMLDVAGVAMLMAVILWCTCRCCCNRLCRCCCKKGSATKNTKQD